MTERRQWTPEEVSGEAQRARDTELYVDAEANGYTRGLLRAAELAEAQADSARAAGHTQYPAGNWLSALAAKCRALADQ